MAERRAETLADALHRLNAKAHAEGIRALPCSRPPFGWQMTSSREGMPPYTVLLGRALHGCDCDGSEKWGRCKHYALALELAGWLPDFEDAAGVAAAAERRREALSWADAAGQDAELAPRRDAGDLGGANGDDYRDEISSMSQAQRRAAAAADLARRQAVTA
jgi:hypothetical protein